MPITISITIGDEWRMEVWRAFDLNDHLRCGTTENIIWSGWIRYPSSFFFSFLLLPFMHANDLHTKYALCMDDWLNGWMLGNHEDRIDNNPLLLPHRRWMIFCTNITFNNWFLRVILTNLCWNIITCYSGMVCWNFYLLYLNCFVFFRRQIWPVWVITGNLIRVWLLFTLFPFKFPLPFYFAFGYFFCFNY